MDPKDQRLVQQSLNQALTQVSALRKQMQQAKRVLQEKEKELRDTTPPQPPAPPANPPAAMAQPSENDDFMPQLTAALQKLTSGCDCPSLHAFDQPPPGAQP